MKEKALLLCLCALVCQVITFSAQAKERYIVDLQKTRDKEIRALESNLIGIVESQLIQLGYKVIARRELDLIINEQGLQLREVFSEDSRVDPGKLKGANRSIIISASRKGSDCGLILKIIDIQNGEVIRVANADCLCAEIEKALANLVKDLFGHSQKMSKEGFLYFHIQPLGVYYSIDNGKWTGNINQQNLRIILPSGAHTVYLSKLGYRSEKAEIFISDSPETINMELLKSKKEISSEPRCPKGEYGLLYIKSKPEEVEVFIDGEKKGKSAGTYKVDCGEHLLVLRKEKYLPYKKKISINHPSDLLKIEGAVLEPNFGDLQIISEPADASIYINGVLINKKTPTTIERLESKAYKVEVVAPFYAKQERNVFVKTEKSNQTHFQLRPLFGILNVQSYPQEAQVYIDGNYVGDTPLKKKVLAGEKTLRLERELCVPYEEKIKVPGDGQTVKKMVRFEDNFGVLKIYSQPPKAEIFIDGKVSGLTPREIRVESGSHDIEVKKEYHTSFRRIIAIERYEERTLEVKLEPLMGVILISGVPEAEVYIDDDYIGKMPVRKSLLQGVHKIIIRQEEYGEFKKSVYIEEDEVKKLEINRSDLKKEVENKDNTETSYANTDPDLNEENYDKEKIEPAGYGILTGVLVDYGGALSIAGFALTLDSSNNFPTSYKVMHTTRLFIAIPMFYAGIALWASKKNVPDGKFLFFSSWIGMTITGIFFDISAHREVSGSNEELASGFFLFPISEGLAFGFSHRF